MTLRRHRYGATAYAAHVAQHTQSYTKETSTKARMAVNVYNDSCVATFMKGESPARPGD